MHWHAKCSELHKPFVPLSTQFHKANIVVGFPEKIISTITDSAQLEKKKELMNYIKNSESAAAPGMLSLQRVPHSPIAANHILSAQHFMPLKRWEFCKPSVLLSTRFHKANIVLLGHDLCWVR